MRNHIVHLFGTHRLPVLTQMKTLTVYHVGNLLGPHPSAGGCKAIDYGFFYLHRTKIANNLYICGTDCRNNPGQHKLRP